MSPCPACARSALVELAVRENVTVELCQGCKGLMMDERALARLLGASAAATRPVLAKPSASANAPA